MSNLLQEAQRSNSIPGVSGQNHGLQQAAQGLGEWVHGQGRSDGVKVLLQICDALIVDLSHVVCGPRLLLLGQVETSGSNP